ncbi:MAG: hypothetical protein J0651_03110 [Actinobacteria bacterium]|nr:hypothetical protein [Actinomycetota bacterium]
MADRLPLCTQANCGRPASKWALLEGPNTLAVCEEHYSLTVGLANVLQIQDQTEKESFPYKEKWAAAKQRLRQFPTEATKQEVLWVVEGYVRKAVQAREEGLYERALQKLQLGKALLTQYKAESSLLCLHLGQVKAYFGAWQEAEAELKQGLELEQTSKPGLQLSSSLVELHLQRGLYEQAIEQGEWTLSAWEDSGCSSELLRVVSFLVYTYRSAGQGEKGRALLKKWEGQVNDSALYQFILLCFKKHDHTPSQEALELILHLPAYDYLKAFVQSICQLMGESGLANFKKKIGSFLPHFPQSRTVFSLIEDTVAWQQVCLKQE